MMYSTFSSYCSEKWFERRVHDVKGSRSYTLSRQNASVSDSGAYQCVLFPPPAAGVLGVPVAFRQFLLAVAPPLRNGSSTGSFSRCRRLLDIQRTMDLRVYCVLVLHCTAERAARRPLSWWQEAQSLECSLLFGALLLAVNELVAASLWIYYLLAKRTTALSFRSLSRFF